MMLAVDIDIISDDESYTKDTKHTKYYNNTIYNFRVDEVVRSPPHK